MEESAQPSSTSSQAEPTHFDDLLTAPEAMQEPGAPAPVRLDRAGFCATFQAVFDVAHGVTGLKALQVPKGDPRAQGCAEALYETIEDVPALHFLLYPQGKWLPRICAIGAFTIPMGRAVALELQERKGGGGKLDYGKAKKAAAAPGPDGEDPEALNRLNGHA